MDTRRNKLAETIMFLTIGSFLAWSVICGILCCTDLTPDYMGVLRKVILVCILLRIIFFNKYTILITLALFALSGILIAGDILMSPVMPDTYKKIYIFLRELVDYILGYRVYTIEYEIVIVWVLVISIAMFLVFTMLIKFSFHTIAFVTGIIFALCFISEYFVYDVSFAVYIFSMMVLLVKQLNLSSRGKAKDEHRNGAFALAAIPMVAVCFAIAYFIPSPKEKIATDWINTAVSNPMESFNDSFSAIFTPKFFSLQSSGYLGINNRLGGNANTNNDVIMEVKTGKNNSPYLAGARKDIYTGYSWLNTTDELEPFEMPEYSMQVMEWGIYRALFYITGHFDVRHMSSLVYGGINPRRSKLSINILNKRTCSIFAPLWWSNVTDIEGNPIELLANGIGDLAVKELLPKNTEYNVEYYSYPLSQDIYFEYAAYKGVYSDMLESLHYYRDEYNLGKECFTFEFPPGNIYSHNADTIPLEDALIDYMIPHAESIYERYLQLPENFPERITELTQALTANTYSDYERAYTIQQFLKSFEYTLTPGITPTNRDFVDYFLFDLQRGYCTSFASAFVTMCRSIGIPARYVEGYMLPGNSSIDGIYTVTRKQGHAWGEVYFEGYGWETFEPTASSNEAQIMPEDPEVAAVFASYDSQYPTSPDYRTYEYELNLGNRLGMSSQQENSNAQANDSSNANDALAIKLMLRLKIAISVIILIVCAVIFIIARFIKVKVEDTRLKKEENNSAAIICFHKIMKYVGFFHYEKFEHETAMQYARRVGKALSFENDTKFMHDIAEIFTKAKYGNKQISDKEKDIMIRAYETVNDRFRFNVGKYTYIFFKYVTRIV